MPMRCFGIGKGESGIRGCRQAAVSFAFAEIPWLNHAVYSGASKASLRWDLGREINVRGLCFFQEQGFFEAFMRVCRFRRL
jgi:hypothetical protein